MTQMELFKSSATLLNVIVKNNLNVNDVKFIDMVMQAQELKEQGLQKSYIVEKLADDYHCSSRFVYKVIKRFKKVLTL